MKIAFLGLGRMGSGTADRLAGAAEHTLTVWNRNPDKAQAFAQKGIAVATDPAAAVSGADLVVTSLLDDASLEAIFHAGSPALVAMKPHAIHLCTTTISAACANRLQRLHAESGTRYVSGPVLGRPDAAASGKLVQFLAGNLRRIHASRIVCGNPSLTEECTST
jgi:3-hydroxyisobutyrate dehydrogenase-like beta-hydroxyacid dehydrogenase